MKKQRIIPVLVALLLVLGVFAPAEKAQAAYSSGAVNVVDYNYTNLYNRLRAKYPSIFTRGAHSVEPSNQSEDLRWVYRGEKHVNGDVFHSSAAARTFQGMLDGERFLVNGDIAYCFDHTTPAQKGTYRTSASLSAAGIPTGTRTESQILELARAAAMLTANNFALITQNADSIAKAFTNTYNGRSYSKDVVASVLKANGQDETDFKRMLVQLMVWTYMNDMTIMNQADEYITSGTYDKEGHYTGGGYPQPATTGIGALYDIPTLLNVGKTAAAAALSANSTATFNWEQQYELEVGRPFTVPAGDVGYIRKIAQANGNKIESSGVVSVTDNGMSITLTASAAIPEWTTWLTTSDTSANTIYSTVPYNYSTGGEPNGSGQFIINTGGISYYRARVRAEEPNGTITLSKTSTKPEVTNGNSGYSMAGIQYTVYTDKDCTTIAKNADGNNAVFILDANGNGGSISIRNGSYYIKETLVPLSSGYILSNEVKSVSVVANQDTPVSFTNEPLGDPIGILLKKVDASTGKPVAQGNASLAGAEYTVKYYQNQNAEGEAYRTWVFKTNERGQINLVNGSTYLVSGDDLFFDSSGKTMIPVGSITIQETKAPAGYKVNPDVYMVKFTLQPDGTVRSDKGVWNTANETEDLSVESEESVVRADVKLQKLDIDGTPMARIPFVIELHDEEGNVTESHVAVTDDNGILNTSLLPNTGDSVNSLDQYVSGNTFTDESKLDPAAGVWFGEDKGEEGEGALVFGKYRVKELRCAANESQTLLVQEIPIENLDEDFIDGKVFELGRTFVDLNIHPETDLIDKKSGTKTVSIGEEVVVTDTVRYDHLKVTDQYKIITDIYHVDKNGTKTKLGSTEDVFTPEKVDNTDTAHGLRAIDVKINTSSLNGGKIAATNSFYLLEGEKETFLVAHNEDLSDTRQMLDVPLMETDAKNAGNNTQMALADSEIEIVDEVTYENLPDNAMYRVEGTLRDSATGKTIKTVEEIVRVSWRTEAVQEKGYGLLIPRSGRFLMPGFIINATDMEGMSLVVTEVFFDYDTDEVFLKHEDLEDERQTIHIPKIRTTALANGIHLAKAEETITIVDTVTYENLVPGKDYVMVASLYDKMTGGFIVEGQSQPFTAASANGSVDVSFTINTDKLAGHTMVAFEKCYVAEEKEENLIAKHEDPEDEDQSIHIPKLNTTLTDDKTKGHTAKAAETVTLVDRVDYQNVIKGLSYTVTGVLMDKDTGKELLVDGKKVTATKTFTAETTDGFVELVFTFNGKALAGKTVVAFETLLHEGKEIGVHHDINDEDQSVHFPKIRTTALADGIHLAKADGIITIVDTVFYENLAPGSLHVLKASLYDKVTGKFIIEGQTMPFTPSQANGSVDMVFKVNSNKLAGHTVVAFEECYLENADKPENLVAEHKDPEDGDQSILYPELDTTLIAEETDDHFAMAKGTVTLVDRVDYRNVIPGLTYTVKGILMDKERGAALLIDGKEVTAETTFVAEKAEGYVELNFTFDASAIAGTTTVAFETLLHEGKEIGVHHDINDEDQSVHFPKIRTTALADGIHLAKAEGVITIIDTVFYENLIPGRQYRMTGTLYVKETGKAITEGITEEFMAEEANGSVAITFTVDTDELKGLTVVAFEECHMLGAPEEGKEVLVAEHKDIEDEEQSVHIPTLKTNATFGDEKSKEQEASSKTIIKDKVTYTNLVPGQTYTVKGVLMDKSTGNPVLINGKEVTAEFKFEAKDKDGSVLITFSFDSSALAGKSLVVFESLYEAGGKLIGEHKDINDPAQTVKIKPAPSKTTEKKPDTGDTTSLIIPAAMFAGSGILATTICVAGRRKKEEEE